MRRGEPQPRAFLAPVDVHASADGQVYMFSERQEGSGVSSEDEEINAMELRTRGRQELDRLGNLQLLEIEVFDGDSLNKLALQYGCKVADLKRVNNLIQEQDLFALKSIKIPVTRHSFLTETNTNLRTPQQGMPNSSTPSSQPQEETGSGARPQVKEYTDFLKEVDHDIEKLIQTSDAREEVFADNPEGSHRFSSRSQRLTGYGADWGIQWWNAVVAMLLIGIILPIFYVVYFKTKDNAGGSAVEGSGMDSHVSSPNSSGPGHNIDIPQSTFSSQDSLALNLNKPSYR
ncbi:lysM and putative peptidoglycan-binding domain-containing protein 4 [Aplochiton taeniatus]